MTGKVKDTDQLDAAQHDQGARGGQAMRGTESESAPITDDEPDRFELELASSTDFEQTKISNLLETIDTLEFFKLDSLFGALSRQALADGQRGAYRAYRVLMVVCSYHFSVDRQDAFGPRLIRDGMRTPVPADICGEQSQVLATIAESIDHPLLRARVADVAWYKNRKFHQSASLSVEAYCQAIEFYLDDKLSFSYEPPSGLSSKVVDLIHRVFHIIASTGKRKNPPEAALASWKRLYAKAQRKRCYSTFDRLARLGETFKIIEWAQVAQDAEELATNAGASEYAMSVKVLWELAAQAYQQLQDHESFKHCKLQSIQQTLKMGDAVESHMAKASWTRDAIRELRSIPGMQKELEVLKAQLLEQQAQAAHEFSVFRTPIDLSEERQGTINIFKHLTLPDFLYRLAFVCDVPQKIALHADIIKDRSDSFLSDLFSGRIYTDVLGRVIKQAPVANLNQAPPPEWYEYESLIYLDIHYQMAVESRVKPAAQTLLTKFALDDRHLMAIVSASTFVPPGFEQIYALGLARFLQGDMMSACHLLFPQLENSLRHVLRDAGFDTSKLDEEMLQEDRSISGLLKNRRDQLESIFGVDLIYTIDLLFNLKGGPCLRHELAHGKLTSGNCYLHSSIYACWLMYYIACLPLLPHWNSHIAPHLEELAL
ncbi:DUF7380 domain-containing protein [Pseudomonas syringae]|uniref:DUF7380 domain-containing protein n=1 Tax=Pseudomonas syringae TaxID=317 RepID=UPI001BD052A9|nr:hypothetical protein [Pseudomonas syringae]MBS7437910.1 hypothetical protein [Pseudomonas syringae]MBS7461925.1 hypothetical protein [Pseudomonas syringae]MEE1991500.1 hypothetical protein [Pseudomonas syringae pv. syringae]MEE1995653.1 hypothetical protein [Pseudomonas syringae pv. syringae]QVK31275.1 hypothetical protein KIJ28_19595 [Pseudomonas syringae]